MEKNIHYYINRFQKLRRDYKNGGAPHKPILLLSILEAIKQGYIRSTRIEITPELVLLFKDIWSLLVVTKHDCRFPLPFYHLRSEPFWELIPNSGCEVWVESKAAMRSFSNLYTAVAFALLDKELYQLMCNDDTNNLLKEVLIQKYFPHASNTIPQSNIEYQQQIICQSIFMDNSESYLDSLEVLKKTLSNDDYEEEVVLRSASFKREVPKLYSYTCAISGLNISIAENVSMLDACHIIPFSENKDDSITNGIALCPNLHRAFDRGLITIDKDYRVITSAKFIEADDSSYSIKQFEGKHIQLPENKKFHPSTQALQWHHEHIFLG